MHTIKNLFALILFLSTGIFGQNNPTPPQSPLDATNWGVVYDIPASKSVKVKSNVPYSGELAIDIYTPPDLKAGNKLPAVIFLNAIGDRPGSHVKDWAIYKSWPRLMAAHGMIGISMDADGATVIDSLRSLFQFLAKDGVKHGIDADRLGVYAASANVTQSSVFLMDENAPKGIKAAVLYYGAAPPMLPRKDLPVLFVVAEGDMPQFGAALPALWQRIAETKAPWTLQMASRLPHAFDAFEDTDESRRVIQQTIAFWRSHLEPVPQPSWKPSDARAIVSAIYWNDPARSIPLLSKYLAANPNDATAHMQYGRMLQQAQRFDEAIASFEKVKTIDPSNPTSYSGIGQIRFIQRRYEEAASNLAIATERGFRNSWLLGQLGYSQLAIGKNEDAIKSYDAAFAMGIPPGANTRGLAYYNLACAYARLKNMDKAFEMLNKAVDEGFVTRNSYETDTDFVSLRPDPRFAKLLERLPKGAN